MVKHDGLIVISSENKDFNGYEWFITEHIRIYKSMLICKHLKFNLIMTIELKLTLIRLNSKNFGISNLEST